MTTKENMKAVSKTAYYCCGVRMQDAESENPLVGDPYARRLMGTEGLLYWETFKDFKKPNAGNVARHYLIDEHVREALDSDPETLIILIGAGLDSRAFRFPSGVWVELDEPAMIDYKNEQLPISECSNPLQRISINFETESLQEKLKPFETNEPVIFIIEGVILYLTYDQLKGTLQTLQNGFPQHRVLCELIRKNFFDTFSKKIHKKLVESGTTFRDLDNHPNKTFLDLGYQQTDMKSTVVTANDHGLINFPNILVKHLAKNFMEGYSVYQFEWTP